MKIALLGDIALFGKMSVEGNPRIKEYFSDISDYLSNFDYVVGNLEAPFSITKKIHGAKSAYICTDIVNIQTLKQLHVNALCLANNHMFDFGKEGYETTKTVLSENGIDYFGTEGKQVLLERGENKIAFSGFCCYSTNPLQCVPNGNYGVNAYNIEDTCTLLKRNAAKGFLTIMAVHAGLEHVNYPSVEHIKAARLMAEICPYVYYGHHPHVIQGIEKYKGSLIAHSLGNFCFDDIYSDASRRPLVELNDNNRRGLILEIIVENNHIINHNVQFIYISKNGKMQFYNDNVAFNNYSDILSSFEDNINSYTKMRDTIIKERIIKRKLQRNISWYLMRLRSRYLKIYINAKKNSKLYHKNVVYYLH